MLCSWEIHKWHCLSNYPQRCHRFKWLAPLLKDSKEQD
uniref:Uncharacterized protein n=1 Tax=Arundo donax TaxID=35708 RepID=A0A0A8YEM9_ARUDO